MHQACVQCGFPVERAAVRCPDCGTRSRRWLLDRRRMPMPMPLQVVESNLSAQVGALRDRRMALEQARTAALERLQGAPPERVLSLTELVRRAELGLAQVAGLVARCNQTRSELGGRRRTLVAGAHRAEWLRRLQRPCPPPMSLAPVRVERRWQDLSARHGALVSPSGRRVALVGGGDVILVDMVSGRAQQIAASGASGLCFSADERCLRFPDGRLWGCHVHRWVAHGSMWSPPSAPASILHFASIPYEQDVAAPDPRWRIRVIGGRCDLVEPLTGWSQSLLAASGQHALALQGGVLVAADHDARRTVLYGISPAPALRWDAWRLLEDPQLGEAARAALFVGLTEELQQLVGATEEIRVRVALLAAADRILAVPDLARQVAIAAEGALSAACFAVMVGDGPVGDRAEQLEQLGLAATVAAAQCTDPGGRERLEALAGQVPVWVDGLVVEAASGSLISLTGGEALRALQRRSDRAAAELEALTMPPGSSRFEPPDPEAALAELAQIQRDISAQLAALEEAE